MVFIIKDIGGHTIGYFNSLEDATRFVTYIRARDGKTYTIKPIEEMVQAAPENWNPVWEYRVKFRNINNMSYVSEDVFMDMRDDVLKENDGMYYMKIYSNKRMSQQESVDAIRSAFYERFGGEM